MSKAKQQLPTDEEKKRAFEMKAELKVYQLYQLAEALNLASTRGAFRGNEMSHVGALFDKLSQGVDMAFKHAISETQVERANVDAKLGAIPEESAPDVLTPVVNEVATEVTDSDQA